MGTTTKVSLWSIQSMPQYQSRAKTELDPAIVAEYADRYREGLPMDPIKVCGMTHTALYVVDGHHRLAAMKQAGFSGQEQVEVEIVSTSLATPDIQWIAAGMNVRHGLRRTKDDKRRAVDMALKAARDKGDRDIAVHCGVSHTFVAAIRSKLGLPLDGQADAREQAAEATPPPPPPPQPQTAPPPPPQPKETPPPPAPPATPPPPPPTPKAQPETPAIPTCDRLFRPIPEELRGFFGRRGEVLAVAASLKDAKEQLGKALKANDPLWCGVTAKTIAALEAVIRTVEDCEPLYLCPACGGLAQEGCKICGNRGGFIGNKEYQYLKENDPVLMRYLDRATAKHAMEKDGKPAEE